MAQDASTLVRPITGNIKSVHMTVDSTGQAHRIPNAIGNDGLEVIYRNQCPIGYFIGLNTAASNGSSIGPLVIGDWGGLPSTSYLGNPVCTTGCADSYTVRQYTIGYCTGAGVLMDAVLHFWDAPLNSCTTGLGFSLIGGTIPPTTATIASITLTGLPRSSAATATPPCYLVTIDAGTPGFTISGGTSFPPGSTMGDRFSWSMEISNTTGGDGPILAGNQLSFSPCNFCAGSLWEIGGMTTNPGTGLGQDNHIWLDNYGGTNNLFGDCFFLGGNPWAGMSLRLETTKPCFIPNTDFCNANDGALSFCPCSNPGSPDTGCDNAQGTGGVLLSVIAQTTSPNGATLTASGFPAGTWPVTYARSNSMLGSPTIFGDGLLCIGPSIVRLGTVLASGGSSTHAIGNCAPAGPGTKFYQAWYQNTPAGFCDPFSDVNVSNGIQSLTWLLGGPDLGACLCSVNVSGPASVTSGQQVVFTATISPSGVCGEPGTMNWSSNKNLSLNSESVDLFGLYTATFTATGFGGTTGTAMAGFTGECGAACGGSSNISITGCTCSVALSGPTQVPAGAQFNVTATATKMGSCTPGFPGSFSWTDGPDVMLVGTTSLGPGVSQATFQAVGLPGSGDTISSMYTEGPMSCSDNLGISIIQPISGAFDESSASEGVIQMTEFNGDLIAGGRFKTVGGTPANCVAAWDGTSWSTLPPSGPNVGVVANPPDPGAFPHVAAIVVSGGSLYVGGSFDSAGGVSATNIARYDGTAWNNVGDFDDWVRVLEVHQGDVYAGGLFSQVNATSVNHIARLSGTTWSDIGGTDGPVLDLESSSFEGSPALYVAGSFTNVDVTGSPTTANNIARYDGTSWSTLGSGTDSTVEALTVFDDGGGTGLFVGGSFVSAGGGAASRVAVWRGTAWSALSNGVGFEPEDTVRCLCPFDLFGQGIELVVVGRLNRVGSELLNGEQTNQTSALLLPPMSPAGPFVWDGPQTFSTESMSGAWNGTGWNRAGTSQNDGIMNMFVFDDGGGADLYASGYFTSSGPSATGRVALWDTATDDWVGFGNSGDGLGSAAFAMVSFDDGSGEDLYVGGDFATAGDLVVNRVARWSPGAPNNGWVALDSGMSDDVQALLVSDNDVLYAAGEFLDASDTRVNYIARWDVSGSEWLELAGGLDGPAFALASLGGKVYVAGDFGQAGGLAVESVARWNPLSLQWEAILGPGVVGTVFAMAELNGTLIIGGEFDEAGSVVTPNIVQWDPGGGVWTPLGPGVNGPVRSMSVLDGKLYVGGTITAAGDMQASNVVCWDPLAGQWGDAGGGLQGDVFALTADLSTMTLYAGGLFPTSFANIATFEPASGTWLQVGEGTNDAVYALGLQGPSLFAGGAFTTSGTQTSNYFIEFARSQ